MNLEGILVLGIPSVTQEVHILCQLILTRHYEDVPVLLSIPRPMSSSTIPYGKSRCHLADLLKHKKKPTKKNIVNFVNKKMLGL